MGTKCTTFPGRNCASATFLAGVKTTTEAAGASVFPATCPSVLLGFRCVLNNGVGGFEKRGDFPILNHNVDGSFIVLAQSLGK